MVDRRRGRVVDGAGVQDSTQFSSPTPDVPTNFRYEEDNTGKFMKWDRDSGSDMVGGSYNIVRSPTETGTYVEMTGGTFANPASGSTVTFKDVSAEEGFWYKVKAINTSGNSSDFTAPKQRPLTTDFCTVYVKIKKIDGDKFTGKYAPRVTMELEGATVGTLLTTPYEDEEHDRFAVPAQKVAIICDDNGTGRHDFYRSSVIENQTYKATMVVGNKSWTATQITLPDLSAINLMDYALFT